MSDQEKQELEALREAVRPFVEAYHLHKDGQPLSKRKFNMALNLGIADWEKLAALFAVPEKVPDDFEEMQKRYQNLSTRGGSLEDWANLGNDYFLAGFGELADECWRKANTLTGRIEA